MQWNVLSLFPKLVAGTLEEGVVGQAFKHGLASISLVNPRDFSSDKYKSVDDRSYGGGQGMVINPEVMEKALLSLPEEQRGLVIYLSPQGEVLNESLVRELAHEKSLTLICGRYDGIDQRFIDRYVQKEISIGDYVISGGELAAAVLIDAVMRKREGTLGNSTSANLDSFAIAGLEAPLYTKPFVWKDLEVPAVLVSGDHELIDIWKELSSLQVTYEKRPDLFQISWQSLNANSRKDLIKKSKRLFAKFSSESLQKFVNEVLSAQ